MHCRLSIIIPIYNVEAYVAETLKSVFEMNDPKDLFEVIVVNDGTKDGSMDIVRQYADRPNLIIVEQENQGLSAARMKGLSMATGEYVWFIDSDDSLFTNAVIKVLALIAEKPGVDVLMFPLKWVYEDAVKDRLDYKVYEEQVVIGKSIIRNLGLPVWASTRFVFRRSLEKNEWLLFPKGLIHEDEYFGLVLMYLSETVLILKDPVYYYHIRSKSITSSRTIRSAYDMVSIHKQLMRFLEKGVDSDDREWFRQVCFSRLQKLYSNKSQFRPSEFSRFALSEGFYVWHQWLKAYLGKSPKNRIGRLFYFVLPRWKECLTG